VSRNGDMAQNGQVKADYVYGTGISLPNASGTLTIASYGTTGMDGAELDAVQWTNAPTGKSLALKRAYASAAGNDVPANWYPSTTSYSATDMGTPGAPNEQ
ncbi:MAG TPA: hypothetical protein VL354_10470, partial [Spirochaetia bacterium]|nr:hypothetical protein [Spirochaetia bacterium]